MNNLILDMIDWRGCPVVEYTPGRVSGTPTFARSRTSVNRFVDWLAAGHSIEEFRDSFGSGREPLETVSAYLRNNPPRHRIDFAGCEHVVVGPDGSLVFAGTTVPVELLFDHMKGGATVRWFADRFGLNYSQVKAVLDYDTARRLC